jgi:hypothetical protein
MIDDKHLKEFLTSQCFQEPPAEVVELVRDYAALVEVETLKSIISALSKVPASDVAVVISDMAQDVYEYEQAKA